MKKLLNKKGFTLMEMLIVVAIIVILVAISIPTFSSQLDNAKAATDTANMRAAKGAAESIDMLDGWGTEKNAENEDVPFDGTLYYNIETGEFEELSNQKGYGQSSAHKDDYIIVEISDGVMDSGYPKWNGEVED